MVEAYVHFCAWMHCALTAEKGQDLVEYTMLLGLLALLVWAAIQAGAQSVVTVWNSISMLLEGAL